MNGDRPQQNLFALAKTLAATYENSVVASLDDHVVRLARMTEPYPWHMHPNGDEFFLGVDQTLLLELEDGQVALAPGDFYTVPQGCWHRTLPAGLYSVNLTLEHSGLETVFRTASPVPTAAGT